MTADILPFVPKSIREREALIRKARATYDEIFPTYPEMLPDTAPCEYCAPESDPA